MKKVHEKIICAGFGGQGIMLMGKLLSEAGMEKGYNVTWFPSYGAEVRGGTAHSMVHIDSNQIASPTISNPTSCVVMNKLSLLKFIGKVEDGGLLIANSSMIEKIEDKKSIKIVKFPLTKLASDLGNIKVANMIAVGAFIALKKIFELKDVIDCLGKILPAKKELIAINKKALELGYEIAGGE